MKRTVHEDLRSIFTIGYRPIEPIFTVDFADLN